MYVFYLISSLFKFPHSLVLKGKCVKGEKGGNYLPRKDSSQPYKRLHPLITNSQICNWLRVEVKGKFVALALYKYISVYLTRMKPLLIGHSEVVQLLLYSGFDPKQKDRFGQVCCNTVLCNNFALWVVCTRSHFSRYFQSDLTLYY